MKRLQTVIESVASFFCYWQLEHYKSVVFYGPEATGKTYLAHRMAHFVAVSIHSLNPYCFYHLFLHSLWTCSCQFQINLKIKNSYAWLYFHELSMNLLSPPNTSIIYYLNHWVTSIFGVSILMYWLNETCSLMHE